MTWQSVISSIMFWDEQTQPWLMRPPVVGFEVYGSTRQQFKDMIYTYIQSLYENSESAAALLDSFVNSGAKINIAESISDDAFTVLSSDNDDGYIALNFSLMQRIGDFNTNGTFVEVHPAITIAHELSHLISKSPDPDSSETSQNSADYDYRGPAVHFQNVVATEMGLLNNIRSYYYSSTSISSFDKNGNYTSGKTIDISRLGTENNDVIDITLRVDSLDALVFAYSGDDIIKTGNGNEYIYGGRGEDNIDAGGGDNYVYGEGGSDIIIISAISGKNAIFAGDDNDYIYNHSKLENSGSIIDGGSGGDIIISYGGTINGGPGSDQFWIPFLLTGVNLTLLDSYSQDSIYWNGNRLIGGVIKLLDAESMYTPSPEFEFGWIDENNVVYQIIDHILEGVSLIITLPGNSGKIKINDYEQGDLGIGIKNGEQYQHSVYQYLDEDGNITHWEADAPYSSVVEDGSFAFGNFEGLFGYSIPGPLITPSSFIEIYYNNK